MNKNGKDAWKYEKIYQQKGVLTKVDAGGDFEHWKKIGKASKWLKYGHSFEGKVNFSEVLSLKPTNLIDIGCGWNEFCKAITAQLGITVFGVDIACPGADYITSAHYMPNIESNSYDLLVSFDCIEHIPADEIDGAFSEFARIADRVFLKICLEDSSTKIDGEGLHVCLKDKEWWKNICEKYFDDLSVDLRGTGIFDKKLGKLIRKNPSDEPRHLIVIGKCKKK